MENYLSKAAYAGDLRTICFIVWNQNLIFGREQVKNFQNRWRNKKCVFFIEPKNLDLSRSFARKVFDQNFDFSEIHNLHCKNIGLSG